MGFFDKGTIAECEALQRQGTVTAVNTLPRTLDIDIGGIVYEAVDVHYHCDNEWKDHSHPHSYTERGQMMSAFEVDDAVLVLCKDNGDPLYVMGFVGNPKPCGGPFLLPVITVVGKDEWEANWPIPPPTNPYINITMFAEGIFYSLSPGGGHGAAQTASGHSVLVSMMDPDDTEFVVNNITMPGLEWNYDDHFALTGEPATWSIRGKLYMGGSNVPRRFVLIVQQPGDYYPQVNVEGVGIMGAEPVDCDEDWYPEGPCPNPGECKVKYTAWQDRINVKNGGGNVWMNWVDDIKDGITGMGGDYLSTEESEDQCRPGLGDCFALSPFDRVTGPSLIVVKGPVGSMKFNGCELCDIQDGYIFWHYGVRSDCRVEPYGADTVIGSIAPYGFNWGTPEHAYRTFSDIVAKFKIAGTSLESIFDEYALEKIEEDVELKILNYPIPELLTW